MVMQSPNKEKKVRKIQSSDEVQAANTQNFMPGALLPSEIRDALNRTRNLRDKIEDKNLIRKKKPKSNSGKKDSVGTDTLVSRSKKAKKNKFTADALSAPQKVPSPKYEALRTEMKNDMRFMADHYAKRYAPTHWKKKFAEWSLSTELAKAVKAIDRLDAPTTEEMVTKFHAIVRDFANSMKDYHVSVSFTATESAKLPFSVSCDEEGRCFISHIRRRILPKEDFPFSVGDEIVSFDGKKPADLIKELQPTIGDDNVADTDRGLAAAAFTHRRSSRGVPMPKKPNATIEVSSNGGIAGALLSSMGISEGNKTRSFEIAWEKTPERIPIKIGGDGFKPPKGVSQELVWAGKTIRKAINTYSDMSASHLTEVNKNFEGVDLYAKRRKKDLDDINPFALGSPISFVPPLGKMVQKPTLKGSFVHYIYRHPQVGNVGYLRIPSYSVGDPVKNVEAFAEIIKHFEDATDALVIDQVNNPGGSVFYLYALASMLSKNALATPKHRMAITSAELKQAQNIKNAIRMIRNTKRPTETARKVMGKSIHGYPVNGDVLNKMDAYADFILSHKATNKPGEPVITEPFHLYAANKINPSTKANYSKPVMLLINEMDFSGGDFFPAIMKDNHRAVLFGNRTSGAGGYVTGENFPSRLGLDSFRITGSLVDRPNGTHIENNGVQPDIEYKVDRNDFETDFLTLRTSINKMLPQVVKYAADAQKKGISFADFVASEKEKAEEEKEAKREKLRKELEKMKVGGLDLSKFTVAVFNPDGTYKNVPGDQVEELKGKDKDKKAPKNKEKTSEENQKAPKQKKKAPGKSKKTPKKKAS